MFDFDKSWKARRPRTLVLEQLEPRNVPAPTVFGNIGLSGIVSGNQALQSSFNSLAASGQTGVSAVTSQAIANSNLVASLSTALPGLLTGGINASFTGSPGLTSPTGSAIGLVSTAVVGGQAATFTPPFVPTFQVPSTAFGAQLANPLGVPSAVRTGTPSPLTPGADARTPEDSSQTEVFIRINGGGTAAYFGPPPRTDNYTPDEEQQTEFEQSAADPPEHVDVAMSGLAGDGYWLVDL